MLTPGTRIGPFEIVASLGAGGMGEVYRARDTRLNRDIALKILPETFARDPERLARFRREAQTLASLNHSNIAQVYGVEDSIVGPAIAMELVPGPTIEDLIGRAARGLPVDRVLEIARQIAGALDAAHEAGIVHRDLKPANVKIRDDGVVKVLDFGLAKSVAASAAGASGPLDSERSPTMTSPAMTAMGMILGTAAYMAPEQVKGRPIDKRADIWAFGVVLYEMLTGRRLFHAESVAETLGLVTTREPDLNSVPSTVAPALRHLLRRCLEKDPRRRLRDIGDALETLTGDASAEGGEDREGAHERRPVWVWIAIAGVAVAAAAATWSLKPSAAPPALRLSIALPPGELVTSMPAISRDGRLVAYTAGRSPGSAKLYIRSLDAFDAKAVDGSVGAVQPFFSPDGRSVAFFTDARLWRAGIDGRAPVALASAPSPWGGTWTNDDTLVFAAGLNSGLRAVPASGGKTDQLTVPDAAESGYAHVFPQTLSGRRDVLFSIWSPTFKAGLLSAETRQWRNVATTGASTVSAKYLPGGILLSRDSVGNVVAGRLDLAAARLEPQQTLVLQRTFFTQGNEVPWLDVSDTGTLVYVQGTPAERRMVWVDRSGAVEEIPGELAGHAGIALSTDGHMVASTFAPRDLRVVGLQTGSLMRIATGSACWPGGWLPDHRRLVFSSNMSGDWELYTIDTVAQGEPVLLLKRQYAQHPLSISPQGVILFLERHPTTGSDLWTLTPDGKVAPFTTAPFNQEEASFSPDGRWIAFVSNESGRREVYASPWPGPGERMLVSSGGGNGPAWSPDGRELFYRADDTLMSVAVSTKDGLVLGARTRLFDMSGFEPGYFHEFHVAPDKRFLMIRAEPASRPTHLNVVLNWLDDVAEKIKNR